MLLDEDGMDWNDPEIEISWPEIIGEYKGTANVENYRLDGGG